MTVQHLKKAMGERLKNSRKSAQGWGKMGKNGERILWGKHFTIGNFPHFSPFFPIGSPPPVPCGKALSFTCVLLSP